MRVESQRLRAHNSLDIEFRSELDLLGPSAPVGAMSRESAETLLARPREVADEREALALQLARVERAYRELVQALT